LSEFAFIEISPFAADISGAVAADDDANLKKIQTF
jgi:hypothetical protein